MSKQAQETEQIPWVIEPSYDTFGFQRTLHGRIHQRVYALPSGTGYDLFTYDPGNLFKVIKFNTATDRDDAEGKLIKAVQPIEEVK